MTAPAAFSFAVVCEADADRRTACDLADRVLLENVDWLQPETQADILRWRGLDATGELLSWKLVASEAHRKCLRVRGRFRSSPGAFDERRARLALRLFLIQDKPPDAVLLVRDTDDQEERIPSLERVRTSSDWPFAVILATPHPKRECWVLAGFDPTDAREEKALAEVRKDLGFDPRLEAERLTAEGRKGTKNAKNVLERLLVPGSPREESCWQETDLRLLAERGGGSRLKDYLEELLRILVPLFAGHDPSPMGASR